MEVEEELRQPTPSAPFTQQDRGGLAVTFSPCERPATPPSSPRMVAGVPCPSPPPLDCLDEMERAGENRAGNDNPTAKAAAMLWPVAVLRSLRCTSPLNSLHNLATSFSIVNDFIFLPPTPPRYRADCLGVNCDDAYECAVRAGREIDIQRWHIPWEHRCSVRGSTIGSAPFFGHGGAPIPVTLLTARQQLNPRGSQGAVRETRPPIADNVQRESEGGSVGHSPPLGHDICSPEKCTLPLLLYFHGNGGDCASESLACASDILLAFSRPCRMLLVEYPGYGPSIGDPSEAYCKACAERVLEFLFSNPFDHCTPYHVVLIAHSIGTGIAVHCLRVLTEVFHNVHPSVVDLPHLPWERQRWVRGVLLLAPFSSLAAVADPEVDIASTYESATSGKEFEAVIRHRVESGGSYSSAIGGPLAELLPLAQTYRDWSTTRRSEEQATPARTTAGDEQVKSDDAAGGPRLNAIYRVGSRWMWNRFESCKVVRQLQERYGLFYHTPLVVVHGAKDAIIPVEHAVRLCASTASVSLTRDETPLRVYAHLTHTCDHNNIFEACEEVRFRHALMHLMQATTHAPPASSPAGLMQVDLGSATDPFVVHLQRHAWCGSTAAARYRLHAERLARIRAAVVGCLVVVAGWVLFVGLWYFVHFRGVAGAGDKGRVLAWSVLECTAIAGIACLTVWTYYYRRFVAREWTLGEFAIYATARVVVYGLVLSCGIVLGLTCALSRSVCGHLVVEERSAPEGSPSAGTIRSVVRWTMIAVATVHILHFVWTMFRNH